VRAPPVRNRRPRATITDLGEFGLIDRIHRALRRPGAGVVRGIGDDTAVLDTGGPRLLLATVDMQVEGRHFIRSRTPPELLGHRVGAVNLSDIGAMGGIPRWALVSLALPPSLPVAWVDGFYRGLDSILAEFGAFVVGGNLSGGTRIVADLTLLGEVEPDRLLTRAGAGPGDLICVTGTLGRSAAGRLALDAGLDSAVAGGAIQAYLAPTPRVREGQALAATGRLTAMLDVSDGIASDLPHICEAGNVGAVVHTESLPIADDTRAIAAALGLDVARLALGGGEDFELLFTVPPDALTEVRAALAGMQDISVIGEVCPAGEGVRFIGADGRDVDARGWDHFAAPSPGPSPTAWERGALSHQFSQLTRGPDSTAGDVGEIGGPEHGCR
jgi:thiamine-monophosphate kinase